MHLLLHYYDMLFLCFLSFARALRDRYDLRMMWNLIQKLEVEKLQMTATD